MLFSTGKDVSLDQFGTSDISNFAFKWFKDINYEYLLRLIGSVAETIFKFRYILMREKHVVNTRITWNMFQITLYCLKYKHKWIL